MSADVRAGLPSVSSLERDLACPGNRILSAGMTSKEQSWTKDGTKVHAVLAGDEDATILDGDESLIFSKEQCEAIEQRTADELGYGDVAPMRHERIWLHDDAGNPIGSGELDCARIKGKSVLVTDFKNGRKKVAPPAMNPQLIGQAVLVHVAYGINEGHLKIAGPWQKNNGVGFIGTEELRDWKRAIIDAWTEVRNPNAPRHAGPHCDYCPARGICPEARAEFSNLTLPSRYDLLDPAGKLQLWDVVQHVEKTVKEIKEQFRADLERDPAAIPGLKLKPGSETITVPVSALRTLIAPEYISALTDDPSVTLTAVASVLTGGRAKTKALSQDGKKKKAELREAWAPHLKITEKAGSIERISA